MIEPTETTAVLCGIKNCDTVKKARTWLTAHSVDYCFHDFRADGIDRDTLVYWCSIVGWETLLNRRSTTWRQLDDKQRENLDAERAIDLLCAYPAMIKRPVLLHRDQVVVGFSEPIYRSIE